MSVFGPLVSAGYLRAHLTGPTLRLIDFRWYLDGRSGLEAYRRGHIPDAVFIDLERITGRAGAGRHPLPDREQLTEAMREAGVGRTTQVVVYDDAGGSVAARLWWLLRWFGHPAVAVLDGGIQAWEGELETEDRQPTAGDFEAQDPDPGRVFDFEQMRSQGDRIILLDARAPERYRGEQEPIDPKAGHIPGARGAFWKEVLGPDHRFRSPEALRAYFRGLGVGSSRTTVAYCGSGVTSCQLLLAMEVAGLEGGRLYPGSWSDWSSRDAPVATGADPG
jgi:thiosulfate/3-mercaptopyruvate sulfurtransferase